MAGGVINPAEVIFGPLQVPPVGEKLETIKGAAPGQEASGVPVLMALTVTTTTSEQLTNLYEMVKVPLFEIFGSNVPLAVLVIPVPDQEPPAGVAIKLKGPLD